MPKSSRKADAPAAAKNANVKGDKHTSKTVKAEKNKAPERRNENKVRGH